MTAKNLFNLLITRNYRTLVVICQILFVGFMLFWNPWAAVPYEVPKNDYFTILIKFLSIFFLAHLFTFKKQWNLDKNLIYLICFYLAWSFISSFFGYDFFKSLYGNYYRSDGLLRLVDLFLLSLIVSYFWKGEYRKYFAQSIFLASTILSLVTFYEIFTGYFGVGYASTFGNPVFLSGYLVVSLPFLVYLYKESKNFIYLLGTIVVSLSIMLIGANGATIALYCFAILYLLFYIQKKIRYFYLGVLVVCIGIILFQITQSYKFIAFEGFIAEGRPRIFLDLWQGFTKRPFFGYGWSNVNYAIDQGFWSAKLKNDVYIDKAHSEIVENFITGGVFGGIIYLSILAYVLIKLYKKLVGEKIGKNWNFTLFSAVLIFVIHSQTNVISITELFIFWFIVGETLRHLQLQL